VSSKSTASTLGNIFSSGDIIPEEKSRIAFLAAKSNSLPAYVLTTYASKTKPYVRVFQKKERIAGFRPGTSLYNKQAISKLIGYLNSTNNGKGELVWDIYRYAAIDFVVKELPALNKLVSEIGYEGSDHDAIEQIKTICVNAYDYGVTGDDVRKFYEICWIPRVPNIEEFLPLCLIQDEAREQKRQIRDLVESLEDLRKSLEDTSNQVKAQSKLIEKINNLASKDSDKISMVEAMTQSLTKEVDSRIEPFDDIVLQLDDKFRLLDQQVRERITAEALKTELDKLSKENKTAINQTQEIVSSALTKSADDISTELKDLESRFMSFSKESPAKTYLAPEASHTSPIVKYKSPLSAVLPCEHVPYKINRELDFLNSWKSYLQKHHNTPISFEQAIAYHAAFLSSNVIISGLSLVNSWIDCLGWRPFATHMVSSPIWTSEEDWSLGAEHVFCKNSKRIPRFLIIHNYDVGLVDCYLTPSLSLWALQGEPSGFSKIFFDPIQAGTHT